MECVMVSFAVAGAKIELDFFEDRVEYTPFRGGEVDAAKAVRLMEEKSG